MLELILCFLILHAFGQVWPVFLDWLWLRRWGRLVMTGEVKDG